jgi:TolB-like protein
MDAIDTLESKEGSKPYFEAATAGKLFISYASPDAAVADKLCNLLEAAGQPCWVAPRDVRAGESYASAIVHAINACRMLVLVLSKNAIQSTHVLREVERASSKQRPILVVRLDAAELPPDLEYFLSANQWLDASNGPLERILPSLVASVRGRGEGEPPREAARAGESARWIWGSVALGIAVVIGILGYLFSDKLWLPKIVVAEQSTARMATATQSLTPSVSDKSIAVLPFADMSEKKDQEYFSDGLSEELIDKLTKIPGLHVPARTSSFYIKGKSEDIPTIARRLMVAHVLEGSVRKSGTHMRVTAQLVRADNGYHLWSETYDRNFDDIFKVQDDIAGAVVKALKVSLLQGDSPPVAPTANSAAYTLYLRAVALAKREDSADTVQAHGYLQEALRLDPQFALAWAALAEIYTDDTVDWDSVFANGERVAGADGVPRETGIYRDKGLPVDWQSVSKRVVGGAHDAAERALKFGPTLPAAHLAMARVSLYVDWDWDAAQTEITKARDLDPGNARILQQAASLAITVGQLQQAVDFAQQAVAQDPLGTAKSELAKARYRMGALPQAEAAYRQLIELYPTASAFHYRYALVLHALGNPQAAYDEMMRDIPPYRQAGLPLALDALGRRADADHELAVAEQKWGVGMAYQISYVYASRNQPDRAMDWLERAYQQHDAGLISMLRDPMLKNLERNSRFEALLRKMHLSQ